MTDPATIHIDDLRAALESWAEHARAQADAWRAEHARVQLKATEVRDRALGTLGDAARLGLLNRARRLREQAKQAARIAADWQALADLIGATREDRDVSTDLPPGITIDLVRWHCARCDARGTWTGAANDPVTEATTEAHRHHARHELWDADPPTERGDSA